MTNPVILVFALNAISMESHHSVAVGLPIPRSAPILKNGAMINSVTLLGLMFKLVYATILLGFVCMKATVTTPRVTSTTDAQQLAYLKLHPVNIPIDVDCPVGGLKELRRAFQCIVAGVATAITKRCRIGAVIIASWHTTIIGLMTS